MKTSTNDTRQHRAGLQSRDWAKAALGAATAGILCGITVIYLLDPVVDAAVGELIEAAFSPVYASAFVRRMGRASRRRGRAGPTHPALPEAADTVDCQPADS